MKRLKQTNVDSSAFFMLKACRISNKINMIWYGIKVQKSCEVSDIWVVGPLYKKHQMIIKSRQQNPLNVFNNFVSF